jgi:hypothetical protein
MMSSLFGSKSKVKAKGGGRLQAVKSVTVPGKCSAISDGDRPVFPSEIDVAHILTLCLQSCVGHSVSLQIKLAKNC